MFATIQPISLQIFEYSNDNVTYFHLFFNHILGKTAQNREKSG